MSAIPGLDSLITFYEGISLERVAQISEVYADDAYFRDPFNEVKGLPALRRIFEHLFTQVEAPAFRVVESLQDGQKAFLVWDFSFTLPGSAPATERASIRGASHIVFDAVGKVASHRDYWDAAELYARLPVVGGLMRWLRRRIATPQ